MRSAVALLAVSLAAACAAPALADYAIPVWTTAQGGGRGSDESHSLTFVVGQPSPVAPASSGAFTLSPGLASLLLDVRPPAILHSPPSASVPDRTALEITADIVDDRSGVEGATVFYREGGLATYRQRVMSGEGDSFSAVLPPSAVTEKGLAYYIEAVDRSGNKARYPSDAPDTLVCVRVRFENLASSFELPAGKYRMVSLPGSTNADPDRVLVDDLGQYDTKTWRLGRWNSSAECSTGCYGEYPDVEDMERGRAFWLISKKAAGFDFSGLSTLSERLFKVHLEKGWNQIGTPFAFDTDWLSTEILFGGETYQLNQEQVVEADTVYVEDNLVSYDGTYHGHQSVMEPWAGYWIYNGSTSGVDLLVNPHGSIPARIPPPAAGDGSDARVQIVVTSPDFPACSGEAGLNEAARDGWDPMDHREPPPIADYLRLVFDQPAWGRHRGVYMTDVRHPGDDGTRWEFRVEASKATSAKVSVVERARLPQTWKVFLYDEARGLRVGLDDLPYGFRLDTFRDFIMLAGTDQFISNQESQAGIRLRSQIVAVTPNPFSRTIDVAFFTPRGTPVEVDIFSVQGRLIKSMNTPADGGIIKLTWNGDTGDGNEAAPGLYFLRLRAGTSKDTAKILKIR